MIDPNNPDDRIRFCDNVKHWETQFASYNLARKESIMHYCGSPQYAAMLGINVEDKQMMGNLIQMGGQAHALSLAYNCPQAKFIAQMPEAEPIVPRLQAGVNRWAELLDLGTTARMCALDSYFGYAIINVNRGYLPPAVREATGMQYGPAATRVSQNDFLFDGHGTDFVNDVSWIGHFFMVPLEVARSYPGFNPELAAKIPEYRNLGGRVDSKVSNTTVQRTAMPMARLFQCYFPHNRKLAIWSVDDSQFTGLRMAPLYCGDYDGHYTGPYAVMAMLDVPDNLLPISNVSSVMRLHTLFNQLTEITSNQALEARYNPVYANGSVRDMQRLMKAGDRVPVPVTDLTKIGGWGIPGPEQSQTMYQGAVYQMFKEFSGNLDDILGIGATAPTATQSEMIRQSVSARTADKRNRMHRFMGAVFQKIAHYFLTTPDLFVPARETIPGTKVSVDMSWLPEWVLPRTKYIDDFLVKIVAYSLEYRDPAVILAQMSAAIKEITSFAAAIAQGMPGDINEFVELQAEMRDLPQLRRIYSGLLVEYNERRGAARQQAEKRENVGQYTRHNVSEKTNQGAMMENLSQSGGANGVAGLRTVGAQ